MPRWLVIDEFRVRVLVPPGRAPRGLRAALADPALPARLRAAVRRELAKAPALRKARVAVSR